MELNIHASAVPYFSFGCAIANPSNIIHVYTIKINQNNVVTVIDESIT